MKCLGFITEANAIPSSASITDEQSRLACAGPCSGNHGELIPLGSRTLRQSRVSCACNGPSDRQCRLRVTRITALCDSAFSALTSPVQLHMLVPHLYAGSARVPSI